MSLNTIQTALAALVTAVPGIGVVHGYERFVREEKKFQDLFVTTVDGVRQVRGWWLRRSNTSERSLGVGRNLEQHTWQIRGYMALNDDAASELVFQNLIELLRNAVRADPTLGGVCAQSPLSNGSNEDGLQVRDVGPVLFCGALCHSALLEITTWSYL